MGCVLGIGLYAPSIPAYLLVLQPPAEAVLCVTCCTVSEAPGLVQQLVLPMQESV